MANDSEEWIPIREAVSQVAEAYAKELRETFPIAREHAIAALLRSLRLNRCRGKATEWGVRLDGRKARWITSDKTGPEIPATIWMFFELASEKVHFDWVSGDLMVNGFTPSAGVPYTAWAFDFAVSCVGIPLVGAHRAGSGRHRLPIRLIEERRGRTRKWDWEGAICSIISQANSLDGLPEGYGAQAKIGRMLSEWFRDNQGGEPVPSEVGARAAMIVAAIEADRK